LNHAALSKPPATSFRPASVRQLNDLPTVLVVGESPAGSGALRSLLGDQVHVEKEADLGSALQRCLQETVDLLFVNLFQCRPSELTALAMFRQTKPEQYVAACTEQSLVEPLEQAGLADALFVLESMQTSSFHTPERLNNKP
jgi:CheY-like chemotaxis protein